jgi:hypothetical protein
MTSLPWGSILATWGGFAAIYLLLLTTGALTRPGARGFFIVATWIAVADLYNWQPHTLGVIAMAGAGAILYWLIGMTLPHSELIRNRRRPIDPLLKELEGLFDIEELEELEEMETTL